MQHVLCFSLYIVYLLKIIPLMQCMYVSALMWYFTAEVMFEEEMPLHGVFGARTCRSAL